MRKTVTYSQYDGAWSHHSTPVELVHDDVDDVFSIVNMSRDAFIGVGRSLAASAHHATLGVDMQEFQMDAPAPFDVRPFIRDMFNTPDYAYVAALIREDKKIKAIKFLRTFVDTGLSLKNAKAVVDAIAVGEW